MAVGVVPTWVKLLITLGVFLIPYGLGVLIARQLKLKEYALKISIVLVATSLGLMPFLYQGVLAAYEERNYENRLKEWKATQAEAVLKSEDIQEIIKENPSLNVNSPEAERDLPKISSANE